MSRRAAANFKTRLLHPATHPPTGSRTPKTGETCPKLRCIPCYKLKKDFFHNSKTRRNLRIVAVRCGELQNSRIASCYTSRPRAHTQTQNRRSMPKTAIVSLLQAVTVFSIIQKRGEPLNCRSKMRRTSKLAYCIPADTPHMLTKSQNRRNMPKTAFFSLLQAGKRFSP